MQRDTFDYSLQLVQTNNLIRKHDDQTSTSQRVATLLLGNIETDRPSYRSILLPDECTTH